MHKTDAPGATLTNEFTEGNPSLAIPATEVGAKWLNTMQRELVEVVESAGLVLSDLDDTQVRQAIEVMIAGGGAAFPNFAIANNQAGATNITGLLFNKVTHKAAIIPFDLMRSTTLSNRMQSGHLFASHNSATDTWHLSILSGFGDALGGPTGVFSITNAGQVQYTSDNMAGASYSGILRAAGILRIKQ